MGSQRFVTPKTYFGLTHRIMVNRLETSPNDPLGITDSACKNQLVKIAKDIRAQRRPVNPRQRSIDSYMHRDLTPPPDDPNGVVAIQEEEESQAGAGAMKKSAGSVDDISSDIIIQQEATLISRKIQQMRRDALDME
ncbi:hypothetical protein F511_28122 [Dorcoceras hygrometricum]|uniref:Uncharacterized protein n=1 Tax=Dorcoceras hygrometricum TaxID=472368 RepID=A0A2Z7BEI4_9LAMI|nr:hypothetical protein F511_28122 [Dorcoceras hygrometricum]